MIGRGSVSSVLRLLAGNLSSRPTMPGVLLGQLAAEAGIEIP